MLKTTFMEISDRVSENGGHLYYSSVSSETPQSVHLPVNTQFTLVPLILASISYSKLKLGTNIQWIQWQTFESYVDPCGIGENK